MDTIETTTGARYCCSVCGNELINQSRALTGIYPRTSDIGDLNYLTVMICPKRLGFGSLFYFWHDRRVFFDDGSEILIKDDEIAISM